jgi:hypothetical protein
MARRSNKVLITCDYGAGWSSQYDDPIASYLLFYEPIIEFLLSGGSFRKPGKDHSPIPTDIDIYHPLLQDLSRYVAKRFKYPRLYLYGAGNLVVEEIRLGEPFTILEYDGLETIKYKSDFNWYGTK